MLVGLALTSLCYRSHLTPVVHVWIRQQKLFRVNKAVLQNRRSTRPSVTRVGRGDLLSDGSVPVRRIGDDPGRLWAAVHVSKQTEMGILAWHASVVHHEILGPGQQIPCLPKCLHLL
jgi:hypothetical protein